MTTYSTTNILFENMETEVDMNSLFTLTYNFDLLKTVLVNLIQSQKATNQKLNDIEDKLKDKDSIIQELVSLKLVSIIKLLLLRQKNRRDSIRKKKKMN